MPTGKHSPRRPVATQWKIRSAKTPRKSRTPRYLPTAHCDSSEAIPTLSRFRPFNESICAYLPSDDVNAPRKSRDARIITSQTLRRCALGYRTDRAQYHTNPLHIVQHDARNILNSIRLGRYIYIQYKRHILEIEPTPRGHAATRVCRLLKTFVANGPRRARPLGCRRNRRAGGPSSTTRPSA